MLAFFQITAYSGREVIELNIFLLFLNLSSCKNAVSVEVLAPEEESGKRHEPTRMAFGKGYEHRHVYTEIALGNSKNVCENPNCIRPKASLGDLKRKKGWCVV